MQIYNVYQSGKRLYIDEKENPDNKIVVNKYDNMQQTLKLISDGTLPPRLYWALRNPKLSNKYFILKLVNNEDLIVGTDISAYAGLWDMLLIGTDEDYEIEGADIDQSRLTYVSDHFGRLFVRDNFLEELDFEEQCSPTFRIFYDEIMFSLGNKVDTKDIPDKLSDLENDTGFISGVALKDDGEGNVKIVGTTFEGSETEEGGGGNYNLPVANETTLGGVKPLNKTEDMTLDVGVDKNGRLFAKGKDITVDSELDKESQNPVQNKVITAEVKALREENEALEQKNSKLEEKNAELESSIEKLQIKSTTDKAPFHHITDSANMKVLDFGMEGITEQDTTRGVNLYSGGDVSGKKATSKTINTLPAGTYTISANVESSDTDTNNCYLIFYNNTQKVGSCVLNRGSRKSVNVTLSGDSNNITFYASNGAGNSEGDTFSFTDIQIEAGEVATEYEPYTGNQPSPNPDYPQEIKLAGVLNEETGRYEHKCCVGNKNLWDKEYASDYNNWVDLGWYEYIPVKVPKGARINVSYQQALSTGLGLFVAVSTTGIQVNVKWLYHSTSQNLIKNSVSIVAETDYIYIHCNGASVKPTDGGTTKAFMKYIGNDLQIEISDTATELLPHASQPFTLTSDRPLTKWDKLVKRDGLYGWSVWDKEIEISNDMTFTLVAGDDGMKFTTPVSDIETHEVMCTIFKGVKKSWVDLLINEFTYHGGRLRFYVSADIATNKDEWGVWLGQNPFKVQAKALTEQAFIPLPEEEQTLLKNLETYYGVTNVYNEQGCPMWLCYTCDSKLYVDQKLEQINNALLSLGANV